jgi:hypothetical protein
MAKLLIEYDETGKIDFTFEDNNEQTDLVLIKKLFTIAEALYMELVTKNPDIEKTIDEILVVICNAYLKSSAVYEVNKKVLNQPVPAVHPLVAFKGFKR